VCGGISSLTLIIVSQTLKFSKSSFFSTSSHEGKGFLRPI